MPSLTTFMKNENMTSLVCVDASLIIRTLIPGPFSDEATALLETWQREETSLIAPALLSFEVTSVLRRLVHLKAIDPTLGDEAFAQFLRIPIRLSTRHTIFPLAWQLAIKLNRSRAYDTAYIALAQLAGCDFWTADERLNNAVREQIAWVKWVGNFNPPEALTNLVSKA